MVPQPYRGRRRRARARAASKRRWYRQQPAARGELRPAREVESASEDGGGAGWLACARCGHRIAPRSARTEVAGQHLHTRLNPYGYVWRFGCFSSAPGVRDASPPSTEMPWFSGHAWQIVHCGRCDVHLGWRFTPTDGGSGFFGLVLELLVEVDAPSDGAPGQPRPGQ